MDYHALQRKLFNIEPSNPAEDLAKLQAMGGGAQVAPTVPTQVTESYEVGEGSLQLDKDYSLSDFAALAGVVTESKQKTGSAGQAKGKDPMPKMSKPSHTGEQPHPLKDKLVGESSEDRIAALEARVAQLEELLSERSLTKGEEKKKEKIVKGMKKNKDDFKKRYGKDAEAVMYATATKNAKKDESTSIKNMLYAKLAEYELKK
jgi:hypothetical protein